MRFTTRRRQTRLRLQPEPLSLPEEESEMGLLRNRDSGATHYRMREKMFSIGDDFWIETEDERRAFKVDGKALRIRETFVLEDPSGRELYTIREKKLTVRDKMEIERDGKTIATVKK